MSKTDFMACQLAKALRCRATAHNKGFKHAMPLPLVLSAAALLGSCSLVDVEDSASPFGNTASSDNAALPLYERPADVAPVDRTIAEDVIRIASQIFTPVNTTLQFPRNNNDALMEYFIVEFADAGYGIQRVSADQGSNFFSYTRTEELKPGGDPLVRFTSSIGAVDIARDYTLPRANTISPAGPVQLSGTRVPVSVVDEPNARLVVSNEGFSSVRYVASLNLNEQAPPVISLITDDVVSGVANQTTGSTSTLALNANRQETNNLFYGGQSNFSSILDAYDQVERQIVVFGNDSLVLGDTNKLLIEQFVQQQLGSDDLISLVGCSNGPTALEIGNEGLALGRAERVTEALQSQGVPRERILDEGCWAPVSAGDKFPSRGVVMELWRKST